MSKNKLLWTFCIAMVSAQLFVPLKMIIDSEQVIKKGKVFKFQLEPIDPDESFRGKYLPLRFKEDTFEVDSCEVLERQTAFVYLSEDEKGLAKIKEIRFANDLGGSDYVKVIAHCESARPKNNKKKTIIKIDYPFKRYYTSEHTIMASDEKYTQILKDSTKTVYGEVTIKDGQARVIGLGVQ